MQSPVPLTPLPIDRFLPELVTRMREQGALVLVAEPGAGKTTRVPRALLLEALYPEGEILVLQPRRIACRMSALRVAEELGEEPGQRIGYQVRFEERTSAKTRVRFITEGILTRRLSTAPDLPGVAAVVLDEFHERSLHADLALSAVARLRHSSRPDLGLLVMSATLDAEPVAGFLQCDVMQVPGRTFPVEVRYQDDGPHVPLEKRVARAVRGLIDEGDDGDILVFLPGAAEIRRAERLCASMCRQGQRELTILHGDLPAKAQDRAVRRGPQPKLILSTNIAETSLTLPAVTAVVDSGLARVASHSPFTGLPTLQTTPISQASAVQRAGRAGRVRAGRCVRLYGEHDFRARPAHDKPELLRADLSELRLHLAAVGASLAAKDWLLPPPASAIETATQLLKDLGALDADEVVSALGRRMLRLPLHPRLSRLLLESEARGIGEAGAAAAALLSERDILLSARARFDSGANMDVLVGPSDLLARIEVLERVEAAGMDESVARAEQADTQAVRRSVQVRKRLRGLLREPGHRLSDESDEEALGMAVLAAFPDRVAKRRKAGKPEVVFSRGGSAILAEQSVVQEAEFLVVLDAVEQTGKQRGVLARMASEVQPEWILELFSERVEDSTEVRFDSARGRADALHVLRYEGLVLDESRGEASPQDLANAVFQAARDVGFDKVFDVAAVETFLLRMGFAARRGLLREPPPDALSQLAKMACDGARTLDDLRKRNLMDYLSALFPSEVMATLEREVPSAVKLPSGRRLQVHYEPDRPPHVASRLQDFFGMKEGPCVAGEPLVLHLLAPNQRAVQVTSDLSGFWERHYPELRKALMRRYPKHPFPDDPLSATPPPPRPPRPPRRK